MNAFLEKRAASFKGKVRGEIDRGGVKIDINTKEAVVVSGARTLTGNFGGSLSSFTAAELASFVTKAVRNQLVYQYI
ncbi:hypothetical protein AGMMS50276_19150 [Synergistales bacterium]|nr:hypothetical protein AGMMS50276_19150 [Synergistales bacterium]